MEKKYIITYTTIDRKTRKYIWKSSRCGNQVAENIITFIKTGNWPEEPFDEKIRNMAWGIAPYQIYGTRQHGNPRQFPNETQWFFYRCIIQCGIAGDIAIECAKNKDLAKAVLKVADEIATEKDAAEVARLIACGREKDAEYAAHNCQNALIRAKNRIRYHQNKKGAYLDEYDDFRGVIEEYELFHILDIKPCA
jgi:hypothetical protein